MSLDTDAAESLGKEGSPEADRHLAENFGMTVRQVRDFDPQTLDATRACKFLGLPPKRFDQLASQPESRGRWVESVARQKKDLIETFPQAGTELKGMLEAIRKFALRKCLKPDGPALVDKGGTTRSNGPSTNKKVSVQSLVIGAVILMLLLVGGLAAVLISARGGPEKQATAPAGGGPGRDVQPGTGATGAAGEKSRQKKEGAAVSKSGESQEGGGLAGGEREKWTPLFNGKNLADWRAVNMQKRATRWEVVDGVLIGSGPHGFLVTEKSDYTEYRFRAEVRYEAGCNSGQVFRYRDANDFYEADVFGEETGSILLARGGTFIPKRAVTGAPVTADKWFVQEVEVRNGAITVSIDGTKVAVYSNPAEVGEKGAVGIQVWPSPKGGTHPVSFRRLEIQDLSAAR